MLIPANVKICDCRRSSVRLPRLLGILVPTFALSVAVAARGDPPEAEIGENAPLPGGQIEAADATVYRWVFGAGSNASSARTELDTLVLQKIAIVDRVCGLTDTQIKKLELAGRGDVTRLIDRIEEIGMRFQVVKDELDKVGALFLEARPLKRGLRPGFSDASLFAKSVKTTLTAEQFAKYEILRTVSRAGGRMQMRERESKGLEINLRGTAFADEGLARIEDVSCLQRLVLDGTQVTDVGLGHLSALAELRDLSLDDTRVGDAGLAHLAALTKLELLSLDGTRVTDAGLVHLKGLTGLQWLWLGNTQVTDTGIANLQRALAKLRIVR
jgi:hypothetical protein